MSVEEERHVKWNARKRGKFDRNRKTEERKLKIKH
jgi:hypothetical protein